MLLKLIHQVMIVIFLLQIGMPFSFGDDTLGQNEEKKVSSSSSSEVKVWYQPRLKRGFHPETMIVNLLGRTAPGTTVEVDLSNIFIIRNDGKEKNVTLNSVKPKSVANKKGIFSVLLELPLGFSQVPLIFDSKRVLLTLDVSLTSVKTNVKITSLKKKEIPLPSEIGISFGLGAAYNSFSLEFDKNSGPSGEASLDETALPLIHFEGHWLSGRWLVNLQYENSSLDVPDRVDGLVVNGDSSGLQILSIGGGYRLKRLPESNWLRFNVEQLSQPFLAESDSAFYQAQVIKALRLGLGYGRNGKWGNWKYDAVAYIHYPFSLSVERGELNLEPSIFTSAEFKLRKEITKKLNYGVRISFGYDVFDYRITDSVNLISNDGSGELLRLGAVALLNYNF